MGSPAIAYLVKLINRVVKKSQWVGVLAKKSEHLAQRFPRAEYFLSVVLAKHGSELGWVIEKR